MFFNIDWDAGGKTLKGRVAVLGPTASHEGQGESLVAQLVGTQRGMNVEERLLAKDHPASRDPEIEQDNTVFADLVTRSCLPRWGMPTRNF